MSFKNCFIVIVGVIMLSGCSSSQKEIVTKTPEQHVEAAIQDTAELQEADNTLPPPQPMVDARTWSPQFIATGFASGIMIEFTGLKKNAELRARYAGIELQRIVPDSTLPAMFNLTATINDLRQAFFKVPPGTYLLRQTKGWAEQSYVHGVEVREGNYSVVTIDVLNPRALKIQPVSDTNDKK